MALAAAFIFFIMPRTVAFVFTILGSDSPTLNADTLPPQVPIVSAPVTATTEATITLNGYSEPASTVKFVLNGNAVADVKTAEDGAFSHELQLSEGANEIKTYAIDEAGNESQVSRTYSITRDSQAPELLISEPTAGEEFETRQEQTITVKGTTEAEAKVYINGRLVVANSEGEFSTTYFLEEGDNPLEIRSTDKAGNTTETELTVSFRL